MTASANLREPLRELLGDARSTPLPGINLHLWLIGAQKMNRIFSPEEIRRILETPYWCFCWVSGLTLACWLVENPHRVRDKHALGFGSDSGVVTIAAAKASAPEMMACDLDPLTLTVSRTNAVLNQVELSYSADLCSEKDRFDLILVADVLYDRANLPLLDQLLSHGREILVADSWIHGLQPHCTGIWQH